MDKDGTLNIIEQVKIMIQSNDYNMHDCEPYLERLNDTCDIILTDKNKALYEKNIATQKLYRVRGRLEDKKLKVTTLEKDLLLEKYARLLSET